jgi:hypothetical protein
VAAAVLVVLAVLLSAWLLTHNGSISSSTPSSTAGAPASDVPAVSPPQATPEGTPGPIPSAAIATSADITIPSPAPNPTATPAPEAGLWRIEGYVVDADNKPLQNVCVVIGPNGCRPFSPHTDARGYWFLDIAEGHTTFDFYFEMPAHQTVWWRVIPEGPTQFNVILAAG